MPARGGRAAVDRRLVWSAVRTSTEPIHTTAAHRRRRVPGVGSSVQPARPRCL